MNMMKYYKCINLFHIIYNVTWEINLLNHVTEQVRNLNLKFTLFVWYAKKSPNFPTQGTHYLLIKMVNINN
jgi:hypothetical protein